MRWSFLSSTPCMRSVSLWFRFILSSKENADRFSVQSKLSFSSPFSFRVNCSQLCSRVLSDLWIRRSIGYLLMSLMSSLTVLNRWCMYVTRTVSLILTIWFFYSAISNNQLVRNGEQYLSEN